MAHAVKHSQHNQAVSKLIQRAELHGFLTWQDILDVFPALCQDTSQRVGLAGALRSQGVEILGDEPAGLSESDASGDEQELAGLDYFPGDDAVDLYLREMSLTPLLTVEEELGLTKRIASGRQARHEITIQSGREPDNRLELDAYIQDEHAARESLIKANTRLVVSIARKYIGNGVPFLDLVQEGNLGLIKAVEKFEYQRGFRFSTYATWWVRQGITRAIADQGRTIRMPVHMADRLRQIYKASHELEQKLGRMPTPGELSALLDLDRSKLRWILQVSQTPISLEAPVGEGDDSEFGMYVEDLTTPSPAQVAYENMLRERLDEILATLTPREARVLRLRFGLGQDRPYTLEEVGQKFGLTRERIRQIEGKALRRLRQPGRARLLGD